MDIQTEGLRVKYNHPYKEEKRREMKGSEGKRRGNQTTVPQLDSQDWCQPITNQQVGGIAYLINAYTWLQILTRPKGQLWSEAKQREILVLQMIKFPNLLWGVWRKNGRILSRCVLVLDVYSWRNTSWFGRCSSRGVYIIVMHLRKLYVTELLLTIHVHTDDHLSLLISKYINEWYF